MDKNHDYKGFRDLKVYQVSYQLALKIFELTKIFPKGERYSLIDQIRRLSRSVSTNIAEAWYKWRYSKFFISKLIDAAGESGETEVWIDFSYTHSYWDRDKYEDLLKRYNEVDRMLSSMINQPEKFCH